MNSKWTRDELSSIYENETGNSASRAGRRLDILERFVNGKSGRLVITDEPDEINHGWKEGRRWSAGTEIDGKICLGYTNRGSRRDNCRSAIFAQII